MAKLHAGSLALAIADDNDELLDACESLLLSEGVQVLGKARTGAGLLQLLEEQPITAVVVDLRLPDLNGLEVARRVAEITRSKTAVIIYTSYADEQILADALHAGARAVVLKDASPENLLAALGAVAAGAIYVDPKLRRERAGAPV
jgi:two-component system, NarL family, invasion response regulator UvrY